ncbi:ubiquitin-specific protease doa4, partial [Dipsacomyces acuminosporus]
MVKPQKSSQPQPRRRSLVTDLNQRAAVDRTLRAAAKRWLKTAERCIDEAKLHKGSGDLENAYIKYMKASIIISEVIPKHKEYEAIKRDPLCVNLKGQLAKHILPELESLAAELRQRPYPEPAQANDTYARLAAANAGETITPEQVSEMEDRFAQMYPEHPMDTSPSVLVPSSKPNAQARRSVSSLSSLGTASSVPDENSGWLNTHQNKFKEIDAQARFIDSSGPQTQDAGFSAIGH